MNLLTKKWNPRLISSKSYMRGLKIKYNRKQRGTLNRTIMR